MFRNSYSLEHLTAVPDILFRYSEINFEELKNGIMFNVSLTKIEQNTEGVLSSLPQNYAKVNKISGTKITFLFMPDTSYSLPHFFMMLILIPSTFPIQNICQRDIVADCLHHVCFDKFLK